MSVEVAIKNGAQTIGEGPHWDVGTGTLLYVDIMEGDVHRWSPSTGVHEKVHLESPVTLIVPNKNGGYIIAQNRSICHLDWDTAKLTTIHTVEEGTSNRFNDGKCDRNGRLWAGTMGVELKDSVEIECGTLYSVDSSGVKGHQDKVTISNGIAWSGDNQTMYFIDSPLKQIFAFDYDAETGNISNRRVAVHVAYGCPDGMTIDTEDKLWVACFSAGRVVRYDPETGKELRVVEIPSKRMTSCCFGGDNLEDLYVTSCAKHVSVESLTLEEVLKQEPLAGSVFRVTGLGVRGHAANKFGAVVT
ncbi:regucalcin-like [Mizuhopecten yessoensis]|uniref:Regucalcin n=1 Tax=Mizuhopecten yessoensis TaxID=6573 RepID=A0A210QKC2_MIZYE|nr:regucalcin-like [Mizuhopecten yessoensis]XP_021356245.1 regucalcin-like [Mizuhopecten yessoensis]OWF49136.1 Regucalcin [Mizuhopecten yessoensis]